MKSWQLLGSQDGKAEQSFSKSDSSILFLAFFIRFGSSLKSSTETPNCYTHEHAPFAYANEQC